MPLVERGKTTNFIVSYDTALTNGATLADALLARFEPDLTSLSALFGGIMPAASLPFHVNLVPGGGGASHPGCLDTDITCYISPTSDVLGVPAVTIAFVPAGQKAAFSLYTTVAGKSVQHNVVAQPEVFGASQTFRLSESVTLYADPGTQVVLRLDRDVVTSTASGRMSLVGRLTDR